ncbi:MAG TPA: DUF1415 family protein [Polyangia bacterium]|nr:DUF1415 family protein [Polyangia bacterium]
MGGGSGDSIDRLTGEALRLHDRYLEEVVLAFELCPWAEKVIRQGRFQRAVIAGAAPEATAIAPLVDALEARVPEPDDIGFAIFPELALPAAAFDRFTERMRQADRARRPAVAPAPFLLAAFHPFGPDEFQDPHPLVPLLRRSPDPTVQLVRAARLDQARAGGADVSEAVARQNFDTVAARGAGALRATLDDIRRDRDATYRRLGLRLGLETR